MVNINGGRAMQFLDPPTYARFVELGISPRGMLSFDEHGNKVREFVPPAFEGNIEKYGVSQVLLPWCAVCVVSVSHHRSLTNRYTIRDELYAALPPGVVACWQLVIVE